MEMRPFSFKLIDKCETTRGYLVNGHEEERLSGGTRKVRFIGSKPKRLELFLQITSPVEDKGEPRVPRTKQVFFWSSNH